MANILITGANGALAKKLIKQFVSDNDYKIFASTRNLNSLKTSVENVEYISNQDLIDTEILKDMDYILNCSFPRTQDLELLDSAKNNFHKLICRCVQLNVKNFINISSQDIYGNYREIPSYEHEYNPQTNYAKTKLECEAIIKKVTKDYSNDMNYTNIRLASLVGVEYPERVINKMINFAKNNKKITVQNDKDVFGYMDINDAVCGLYNFVKNSNSKEWKDVYNLGVKPDYDDNLLYIAQIIKNLFDKKGETIELEISKKEKADKLCLINSEWFYKDSNWQPQISLEESIKQIFLKM